MAELLRMPEVAAGAESALLSAWPLAPGSSYAAGDVIAIIETDKAVVDYEAEAAGVIVRPLVTEGTEVAIGDPIAVISAPGEAIDDVDAIVTELVGSAPAADTAVAQVAPAVHSPGAAPVPDRIFASPLARRMALDAGIDLATVTGSGPQGRIRRVDIEAVLAAGPVAPVPSLPAASPVPAVTTDDDVVVIPHSRLRRAIATRLTQSKTQAPHFYLRGSARVDRLLELRQEINDGEELRVSVTDLLLKAMAVALTAVPTANVIWTDEAVHQHTRVDIGLAVATDNGLVTPVVRGVDRLTVRQIAQTTQDLAMRARAGSLRQHELEGGVTSLTNLGMYGTEDFDAIINPPQSSILAVGAARETPVVTDGAVAVATVLRFSLSVDHRPIDGATAAQWMAAFTALLERPAKLLA
ncbi:MAG: dihydrolipoamide acetyltransferase family protein [Candidatus Nanopelagicales bacterium]